MTRVYVGNLDSRVTERELEDEFRVFGVLRSIWVARKPPGYAFIDFDDRRDALDTIRELDGKNGWRVELSHNSRGGGGRGGSHGRSGRDEVVEDVVVAPHLDIAEAQAMVEGVIVLMIVPQGGAVSHLFMVGAIASHHPITVGLKNHHMPIDVLWSEINAEAGVEDCLALKKSVLLNDFIENLLLHLKYIGFALLHARSSLLASSPSWVWLAPVVVIIKQLGFLVACFASCFAAQLSGCEGHIFADVENWLCESYGFQKEKLIRL
ncbi:hypothetical protein AAC387_Pa05g2438 [Persea americana]